MRGRGTEQYTRVKWGPGADAQHGEIARLRTMLQGFSVDTVFVHTRLVTPRRRKQKVQKTVTVKMLDTMRC